MEDCYKKMLLLMGACELLIVAYKLLDDASSDRESRSLSREAAESLIAEARIMKEEAQSISCHDLNKNPLNRGD